MRTMREVRRSYTSPPVAAVLKLKLSAFFALSRGYRPEPGSHQELHCVPWGHEEGESITGRGKGLCDSIIGLGESRTVPSNGCLSYVLCHSDGGN